jgi:hypothetical protein
MGERLNKVERRAVAQRIFAALCARYPDRYIALFECSQMIPSSPDQVLTTSTAAPPVQGAHDGTDSASG